MSLMITWNNNQKNMRTKISDTIYANFDNCNITITRNSGNDPPTYISLAPEECATLVTFIEECYRANPTTKNKQ